MKKIFRFIKIYWQFICACLLVFTLVFQLIMIAPYLVNKRALANVTDWGLSFKDNVPKGNMSKEDLEPYDSYYIGNKEENVIYLTFDAGYENGYMSDILDVLREEEVPAAFFLVGHYLKSQPDLVKRMVNEGHLVCNHTYTHPDMSKIADLTSLEAELESVRKLYCDITGCEMPKIYRPPQGKFSLTNLEQAKELGYKTVFWSLAYVDWDVNSQPSEQTALDKLNGRIHNGAVVLLHSTSKTNRNILKDLIQGWKDQGYTFKPITELIG